MAMVSLVWLSTLAAAQFLSFDYGSEFFKTAMIEPNRAAEIVGNFHSKRKTATAVSFMEAERVFGDDALGHQGKAPHQVPLFINALVGAEVTEDEIAAHRGEQLNAFYPLKFGLEGRSVDVLDLGKAERRWSVEAIVGHILGFARRFASAHAEQSGGGKGVPKECVLTIPAASTQRQRAAWRTAALVAGLTPRALVHETSAAVVHRAVDQPGEQTTLFFNMGAIKTEVCVALYGERHTGMVKGKGAPTAAVLGCAHDPKLGGHFADLALVEAMLKYAEKSHPGVRQSGRAMRKLLAQAAKTKHVLSTNKASLFKVEALHEDKDFAQDISRADFEPMIADMLSRIPAVIDRALEAAGVALSAVTNFELLGGGWRIPKVQEVLQAYLAKNDRADLAMGQHLNGDEAMALGALHIATNGSAHYRSGKVFFQDVFPHTYRYEVFNKTEDGDQSPREVQIGQWIGAKKKLSFHMAEGEKFGVRLFENDKQISEFDLDASKTVATLVEQGWSGIKAKLVLGSDALGLHGIREALVTADKNLKWEEEEAERKANETAAKEQEKEDLAEWERRLDEAVAEAVKEAEAAYEPEEPAEGEEAKPFSAENFTKGFKKDWKKANPKPNATAVAKAKPAPKEPSKKLKFERTWAGYVASEADIEFAVKQLAEVDTFESELRKVDEIANNLEGEIYGVKEKLEEEVWHPVTSEQQREELLAAVQEVQTFLEEDTDRALKAYQQRAETLSQHIEPIVERQRELEKRPDAVQYVENVLEKIAEAKAHIEEKMTWVPADKVEKAWNKTEEFKAWWEKKAAAQAEVPNHEAPVYMTATAREKAKEQLKKWDELRKTDKPKEKKEKPKKDKDKKKDKKDKKDKDKKKKDKKKKEVLTKAQLQELLDAALAEKAAAVEAEDFDKAQEAKERIADLKAKIETAPETAEPEPEPEAPAEEAAAEPPAEAAGEAPAEEAAAEAETEEDPDL